MTTYSGYTAATAENLLLDAGAFFVNFDIQTDSFDSAVLAGKLLGATRGGGQFSAVPEIRAIEVDGVKGKAKGLQVIDSWEVKMTANVLEVTKDGLAKALTASQIDTASNLSYDIITAKNSIALTDYITNITFVGKKSGASDPVIIQLYNALNTTGLTLQTEDKGETVITMEFEGHYDDSALDAPPFAIYYPKSTSDTTAPTVAVIPADAATGVVVTSNVVWTFNEAIKSSDVTAANFFVMAADGALVPGALSINADKTVVTFDPTASLAASTAYVAIATSNVKDLAGNPLVANSVTNFTTA